MNWLSKLAVVAALCAAIPASAQTAAPGAEAYGRLPAIAGASISPDGRRLIVFVGEGNAGRVSIYNIEDNSFSLVRTLNAPEGGSIRGVDFADDRYGLITISQTFDPSQVTDRGGYVGRINASGATTGTRRRADATESSEFIRQLSVDITTGQTAFMLSNARYAVYRQSLGSVTAPIDADPGFGRMVSVDYGGNAPRLVVYRVNLANGAGSIVERGTGDSGQFCTDAAGNSYARMDYEEGPRRWTIFSIGQGGTRAVASGTVAEDEEWRIPSMACRIQGRPPNIIAVSGYDEGATRVGLRALDLNTGEFTPLYSNDAFDAGALRDPYTREVIGWGWTKSDADENSFFDPQIEAVYRQLAQRFGGAPFSIDAWDRARARFIVSGDTIAHGPGVFMFEPAANRLRVIGYAYPELAGSRIPVREAITYRARDGVRIPAFLTLPPGVDPTNLPLVVMPHGGPHAQNVRGFDWWSGFMASRGYAVLEPDFRGSTGYGREWQEAGHGNWGNGVMQHDVTDGVQALIQNGTADASRVCIVGASYGGYAALAGAAFTPDLYACAISVAGVSDMGRMFNRELRVAGGDSPTSRFWRTSMGADNFERDSPARHVDGIRAPVLLIHGAHDTIVPYDQSTFMERRMREAGKPVRLVELPGDDHWLSDASTRTLMLREVDQFLAQHIGQPRN